jgi:hypothetical protein
MHTLIFPPCSSPPLSTSLSPASSPSTSVTREAVQHTNVWVFNSGVLMGSW